jgi:hypothetical protein
MSRFRQQVPPAAEQAILSYLRAGSFPHVAAEAAGVPADVFEGWLLRGRAPRASAPLRAFARGVMQAHAQARVAAEVAVHQARPLDWLKSGPGRQQAGRAGWTGPARATDARPDESQPLLDARWQVHFARLLGALEPHPEARAAAAEVISSETGS